MQIFYLALGFIVVGLVFKAVFLPWSATIRDWRSEETLGLQFFIWEHIRAVAIVVLLSVSFMVRWVLAGME